VTGEKCC